MTFTSPLLPHDLDVLTRPVTYVTWTASSHDDKEHAVAAYLDVTAEWAVDKPEQLVACQLCGQLPHLHPPACPLHARMGRMTSL